MEIAVVGSSDFTLGFQLAGIDRILNPPDQDELIKALRELLRMPEIGIIVVDSDELAELPEKLRRELGESITPTVLGIGTTEDTTLRQQIRSAIGVDLWQ